jgi:V8-like Glu-specific endopeptidase
MKPLFPWKAGGGRTVARLALTMAAALAVTFPARADGPEIRPYSLLTGEHTNTSTDPVQAKVVIIEGPETQNLLRIHFGAVNLGERSYVVLTSLKDGGRQQLDRVSMGYWENTSAIFNGNRVQLELFVAPGEQGIFANVDSLRLECDTCYVKNVRSASLPKTLCGPDSRVASTDNRVGRISGCTAWLVSNGGVLTAGHCGPVSGVFEVNVPASSASGTPVASAPADQFPIDTTRRTSVDNGNGDDYTVFALRPNTSTGSRAHLLHGFFRMSRETPLAGATIRITGFGVDNTPAGPVSNCCATDSNGNCTHPNCNAQSRTLQTSTGSYVAESGSGSDIIHSYQTDTEPANSGSPIIWNATGFTIGIHTHGGCTSSGGSNSGTSFENDGLTSLVQNFPGLNTRYVDVAVYPNSPVEIGTVFQPYNTVTEAVATVVSGGRISIVEGSYTRVAGNTMVMGADGKSFLVEAPVGTVTIGH